LQQQRTLVEQALHALGLGLDLASVTALGVLHLLDLLLHLVANCAPLLNLVLDLLEALGSALDGRVGARELLLHESHVLGLQGQRDGIQLFSDLGLALDQVVLQKVLQHRPLTLYTDGINV
jgi:hypothetical protein